LSSNFNSRLKNNKELPLKQSISFKFLFLKELA
jgi:hypothetical protein